MTENKEMTREEKRDWVKSYLRNTPVQKDGKKIKEMTLRAWGIKEKKSDIFNEAKEIFK